MKRPRVVCALLFLLVFGGFAAPMPTVAVIASPSIRHVPSVPRVARALHHAALDLDVGEQALPNVVLVCADRHTAEVMKLQRFVALSIDAVEERQVYRVSIVDDTSDQAVAAAMVWLVNTHFRLGASTKRMTQLAAHIRDELQQTVDAEELAATK